MRLFLIRHGAVIAPQPQAFYGATEVPLSAEGRREAQAAALALAEEELHALYSSPLGRARHGAQCLREARPGLPLQVLDELAEIQRGCWVGLTAAQVQARYPGQLEAHAGDLEGWRGHGGESLGDLRRRVLSVQEEFYRRHAGQTVVAVCHLFPIRALLADALDLPLQSWDSLAVPTGSLSLIEYAPASRRVAWYGRRPVIPAGIRP